MAKRDKYDDDSIFSTPENNPALFRSLLGLTENFYKTRNKYAEKYGVEEIRDQLRRTKKGTEERLNWSKNFAKQLLKLKRMLQMLLALCGQILINKLQQLVKLKC